MGLMDKPKSDFEESYVDIDDFVLYLSFKLKEPVETVISWLLYNGFDKDINSYETDKHYRVCKGVQIDGIDKNIDELFKQISIDGYFIYMEYLDSFNLYYEVKDAPSYEEYQDVNNNFYLKLNDLEKLEYIKPFNLSFSEARLYNYTIYICDSVTANLVDMNTDMPVRVFKRLETTLSEYEKIKNSVKNSPKNNNSFKEPMRLDHEKLQAAFKFITGEAPLPNEDKETKQEKGTLDNEPLSSRSQDKKLIAILALLLASKSKTFTVGDKPNATQISKGIYEFAIQNLRVADEDMNGLKAPIAKISKAIQDYSDILYKRPDQQS
ncbi:hypothetical protein [uncultured Psychrobacter sp.]|uniref:hypothetical protein n=1 Tax=uncultured Psychrobacter sp. TaxID=259303 RepID=UPI00262A4D12|nr:hypothetical protein [uncultured Psychrobacter sp.]